MNFSKIFTGFSGAIFSLLGAIFAAFFAAVPAKVFAQDVVVDANIQAVIRQGILPIHVSSPNDEAAANFVAFALGKHGAFDVRGNAANAAVISIKSLGNGFVAESLGAGRAFSERISVSGTGEAALSELCDKIVVAVGKTFSWNLKPIFTKTRLAFSSNRTGVREIYASDLLFRDIKQITRHGKCNSLMPHWEPNGERIFYTTYIGSGAADVYFVEVATGKFAPFATFKNTNNGGAVSPDGRNVALALSAKGPMNIYVRSISGGNARQLCGDAELQSSPTWSPDSREIVFVSGPDGRPNLYRVPASGGKKGRISTGFSYATDPAWSAAAPDKIAFSYAARGCYGIAVYDVKTQQTKDLCENLRSRKLSKPTWCADGRHIVAIEEVGKNSWLVLLDSEAIERPKCIRISPASLKDCFDPDALVSR